MLLNKTTMGVVLLAGHLFLAGGVTPAFGERCWNLGIQVDPPNPLESTPVTVTLAAECNDTCLSVCDAPSANAGAFAFHIDWYIRDVIAQTGCLTVIVTLSSDVVLGLLDAGDYVVTTAAHVTGPDTPCTQATLLEETGATFRVLPDCNANGIPDGDDIAGGTSDDCNGNGVPDECEPDCNGNGVADGCDIAESTAADCNENGVPDACDLADGSSRDFNGNGVPDECDGGIPVVSAWGLIIMGLLLLAGAKTHFGRRGGKPQPSRASSLLLLCTVTLLSSGSAYAQRPTLEAPHDPERLLVRFKPGTSDETKDLVNAMIGATELKRYRFVDRLFIVRVPEEQLATALGRFLDRPEVLYAEPDYLMELTGGRCVPCDPVDASCPDDPEFQNLWGLHNFGQTLEIFIFEDEGTCGADIDAPEAWAQWTGDPTFRIAVIDSGVNYNHVDLVENIWTNPGEIPGNGVDDDQNGWIDDIHGYDFLNDDGDPMDIVSHGTHVAGIIGARGNNGLGVTGVNWQCQIVALKVTDGPSLAVSAAIEAMDYVIANNIRVSNNSYRLLNAFSQAHYDAVEAAQQEIGHIFVAAAANDAKDIDTCPSYPAAYDLANIISVAATDNDDNLATFSNFGATAVDLGAPGSNVFSTVLNDGYALISGTSMAAPHVTGVVGLVMSRFPGLGWREVIDQVLTTVRPLSALAGKTVTGGILNAGAAVVMDCNTNGISDDVEIAADPTLDCIGNGNGILDACEADCNENTVADTCDIANGTSQDCNGNRVPDDECECPTVSAPLLEDLNACYLPKSRYLSFAAPEAGPCYSGMPELGFRVTFVDLPPPFAGFNGTKMWVGQPTEFCESPGQDAAPGCGSAPGIPTNTFWGAPLQCDPFFTDWSTVGPVHIFGEGVVPGAVYEVQAVHQSCVPGTEGSFSAPLTMTTGKWGDVVEECASCPCTPPDGSVAIVDVTSILDKFQNAFCAPVKVRCDLDPDPPDQKIGIIDVTRALDAFGGVSYPFGGPSVCP